MLKVPRMSQNARRWQCVLLYAVRSTEAHLLRRVGAVMKRSGRASRLTPNSASCSPVAHYACPLKLRAVITEPRNVAGAVPTSPDRAASARAVRRMAANQGV